MIENREAFHNEIEKLSLSELETRIKGLYLQFQRSSANKDDKLHACLWQRKYLINRNFKFTPEAVKHIERVNRILTEGNAMVLKRCGLLFRQMLKLKKEGDDFLDDFEIEGSISFPFGDEESVLVLDEDENNGQSDYVAMADVLDYTSPDFGLLTRFHFSYSDDVDWQMSDEELRIKDDRMELNWNIELLDAPELSAIKYFCYGSHILFVDMNYSLSDAIRLKNFAFDVKVTHKNWGEKLEESQQLFSAEII